MRLLIIRHGDPDYETDTLTEQGRLEARLLAEELSKTRIDKVYVSPLGRARLTAKYTLDALGMDAEILYWLREFDACIQRPDRSGQPSIAWDWLPQDLENQPDFYTPDTWTRPEIMADSDAQEKYNAVCTGLDAVLKNHGYQREGHHYRVCKPNSDTIAFFCHFGVESVMLSHLLRISPMPLWHGFCALTSSVTTVYTEERREGTASFRVNEYGSIYHLRRAGIEPSFSARFCERFDDDARHD